MRLIGLTGGIASGKSAVARMLRGAGIDVIDADQLAREVVLPGTPGLAAIVERFGPDVVVDGQLDRKKLGALVYGDDEARLALNRITHPRVAALAMEKLQALQSKPVVVYEVPLLFENNLEGMMEATILVAAPVDVQLARLMKRDSLDEAAAKARIAVQMKLEEKRARATEVIENDGSLEHTAAQLRAIWRRLTGDDVDFAAAEPQAK